MVDAVVAVAVGSDPGEFPQVNIGKEHFLLAAWAGVLLSRGVAIEGDGPASAFCIACKHIVSLQI